MSWTKFDESRDKNHAHSSSEKLQVHQLINFKNSFDDLCILSLKQYGDMPEQIVWDPYAFIGSNDVEIKVESRF